MAHIIDSSSAKKRNTSGIYHEKQERMLCAKHALNNLLQSPAFTAEDLDRIGRQLTPDCWMNQHKTPFFGNYDVNVVIKALQTRSYSVDWFDKRLNPADQNFDEIFGFILNIPTSFTIAFMNVWNSKHWVALRKINGTWYNLDSKLPGPSSIGNDQQVREFLQGILQNENTNLFVVKPESANINNIHDANSSS